MINFNGNIVAQDDNVLTQNRAFLYGDGVFETLKIVNNKILFVEDHYFRLMASMRVVRMEIPMNFTMEYFEEQVLNLVNQKIFRVQQEQELRFLEMMEVCIYQKQTKFHF